MDHEVLDVVSSDNYSAGEMLVKRSSIVGVWRWPRCGGRGYGYSVLLDCIIGHGINGSGGDVKVTEECYERIKKLIEEEK